MKLRLGDELEKQKKSVYWLNKTTGISYVTLHNYAYKEINSINIKYLKKIADALGVASMSLVVEE